MKKHPYRRFLLFQGSVGIALILVGIWFPAFIYHKYGFTYQNIYDLRGHVKDHGVYFYYGLAMGGLSAGLGVGIFALARYFLRRK